MDSCHFSGLNLKQTPFVRCLIRESRFVESVLTEANFEHVEFERTVFHHCELGGANFLQAQGYSIDPTANRLKGARFSFPEVLGLLQGFEIKIG